MDQRPSVGRIIHYVSYGTPGGEYTRECRSALVTEADLNSLVVGLCAINPTGLFFHPLNTGGCTYDDGDEPAGDTWHWPERV